MEAEPASKRRKGPNPNAAQRKRQAKRPDGAGGAGAADGGGGAGGGAGKKQRKSKADKSSAADDLDELVAREEGRVVYDEAEERLGKVHSGVFSKDLPWLMYGFGDADKPLKETVDLVEDIAVQFITETVHAAMRAAAVRSAGASSSASAAGKKDELKLEDLLYAVRRDPRKVARVQDLIRLQQQIKDARKVVDVEGIPEELPE